MTDGVDYHPELRRERGCQVMSRANKGESCKATDLAANQRVWRIWGVPGILFLVGAFWGEGRLLLWVPSLSFAGLACLFNATRCGRLHCHLTGPLYLLAALATLLSGLEILPVDWRLVFSLVIGGTLVGYALEYFRGLYVGRKDCCAPENKGGRTERKGAVCPSCRKKGKSVGRETIESVLRPERKENITPSGYLFCETPDCAVVYYSVDSDHTFLQSELAVPVTVKDPGLGVPVCYCFAITRQRILDEIRATGSTASFEEISAKVKQKLCACELKNPEGSCCLGKVSRWIILATAFLARETAPSGKLEGWTKDRG